MSFSSCPAEVGLFGAPRQMPLAAAIPHLVQKLGSVGLWNLNREQRLSVRFFSARARSAAARAPYNAPAESGASPNACSPENLAAPQPQPGVGSAAQTTHHNARTHSGALPTGELPRLLPLHSATPSQIMPRSSELGPEPLWLDRTIAVVYTFVATHASAYSGGAP